MNDRIILDTGDGAAISFIGDPEDALFVATSLRDAVANLATGAESDLSTRMGITVKSAYSQLYRIRQALAECMRRRLGVGESAC